MSTPPLATIALLLAALLAALAGGARCQYDCTRDQRLWYQPCDLVSFNVAAGDYSTLRSDVHNRITSGSKNIVGDKRVLRKQNAGHVKPPRWLLLELVLGKKQKITLAIRQDNLYITAFTGAGGQWYVFQNRRSLIPVADASTFFVDDDYGSLVAGYRNLAGVRASRLTLTDAVAQVAGYTAAGRGSADVGCVSRALAIMAVTFAEASRLQPLAAAVTNGFSNAADGALIGEAPSKFVVQWKRLSCAVLIAKQNGERWDSDEARALQREVGIRTQDEALRQLQVVLWPRPNSCSVPITGLVDQSGADPLPLPGHAPARASFATK